MYKKLSYVLLLGILILLLASCGGRNGKAEQIDIMFLSEIPAQLERAMQEKMIQRSTQVLGNEFEKEIKVQMYPVSFEKVTIEIMAGDTDMYIVDQSLLPIVLDPYGLAPLNSLLQAEHSELDQQAVEDVLDEGLEPFILIDEDTGERNLYAIPIHQDSWLIQEFGIEPTEALAAVVIQRSQHIDEVIRILGAIK
ncbi:hypothetical protein [Bacillus horti]|uniref:ABC-type glycerol-3-phosphate transport system substrate-binding protein n=1 Tax=Caldalkalibacillus horti TaxID=77523 RepID=A0ABT9W2K4_9BACI|nr:hypothetical protein [Bacillus horti]MDQ0167471.1 ABC-type glycerol-3-phosphate transport system substrate-binding protein [Bacillus horti]